MENSPHSAAAAASEAIEKIVAPAREELARIDGEIETKLRELDELKGARRPLARVLNAANPQAKPGKKSAQPKGVQPSQERKDEVLAFLRSHPELVEITARAIHEHPEQNGGISRTYLNAILQRLHEEGSLRLDRLGPQGSKIYKLTS
jgi:hypothetical protein